MEQRVTSEFDKYLTELWDSLRERFGSRMSPDDLTFLSDQLNSILNRLIQLMREGKSAHEKFFSDIILNSIDAVIGLDEDFKVFLWNKGAENIFGYSREEITGKDFTMLIPENRLKQGEKEFLINEVRAKGFLANYQTERLTKNGELKYVSVTRFAVKDQKGQEIGSVGIVRDITELKNLEKELREKENLALIGEVVSSIAHSLSNPLNIISGNADYLLLEKKEGDPEYEELKTILEEATRITRSIRHLLNFSRPLKTNKEKNNINELVDQAMANAKFIRGAKQISFKKILGTVPEFSFDKAQISEVISNLVTNAVQAIPSSGEVKIVTSVNKSNVFVEVSDTGTGIEKENLEKIFQPFYSSKEYGKGTGLGLSIAKRIVKEHGGDISVTSRVGKGTTFTVSLPLE